MSRGIGRVLACAAIAFLAALPLRAQATGAWSAVTGLPAGEAVRLSVRSGSVLQGKLVSSDAGGVRLLAGGAQLALARGDVLTLAVRGASHRTRNILLGAGAGVAAGVLYCAAAGRSILGCRTPTPPAKGWAISLGGFGALGSLVGALLPSHGWSIVYRAAPSH